MKAYNFKVIVTENNNRYMKRGTIQGDFTKVGAFKHLMEMYGCDVEILKLDETTVYAL